MNGSVERLFGYACLYICSLHLAANVVASEMFRYAVLQADYSKCRLRVNFAEQNLVLFYFGVLFLTSLGF